MSGDDLTIATFLVSLAATFGTAAVSLAGWKHKAVIVALFIVTLAAAALGLGWPWVKEASPRFSAAVAGVATSGVAWFVVVMFGLALALFAGPSRRAPRLLGAADPDLMKRTAAVEMQLAGVEGRVSGLEDRIRKFARDMGESAAGIARMRSADVQDVGKALAELNTRIAAVEAVAGERLDQRDALFDRHYNELRAGLDALLAVVGASALPPKQVRFDPTTHDGLVTLGAGALRFAVRFFTHDSGAVGVSKAGTNLKAIARVKDARSGETVRLADHDHTSRDYVVKAGEHFIAENDAGRFLIARIDSVEFEGRAGADKHEVCFTYRLDLSGQPAAAAI